jgi:hypothetical protein
MFYSKGLMINRFKDMARNSPQRLMETDGSEAYQDPGRGKARRVRSMYPAYEEEGRLGQENLYLARGSY